MYEICEKCDGNQYVDIYRNFTSSENSEIKFPFNTRILIPFLASIVNFNNPILSFHAANILFTIISISIIYALWVKLKLNYIVIFIGLFWMMFHWIGIIRHNIFDPLNVDTPLYLFGVLLLLIAISKKWQWLPLLTVIAMSQKESFLAYLLVLLIYCFLHNRFYEKYFNLKYIVISVITAFGTKLTLTYMFPYEGQSLNSFIAVLYYIKDILANPEQIVVWIVAIFTSFGALILLALQSKIYRENKPEYNILFVLMLLSLALSIIAGGDFTRISFLGFPFIMTWILKRISEKSILEITISVILSIPLMRLFTNIPQPNYSPVFHPWFPEFSNFETVSIWGLYLIFCWLILQNIRKFINS